MSPGSPTSWARRPANDVIVVGATGQRSPRERPIGAPTDNARSGDEETEAGAASSPVSTERKARAKDGRTPL